LRNADEVENSDGTMSFIPNQYIFLGALVAAAVAVVMMVACSKLDKSKAKSRG
jgi:hypothetical protein